MNAAITAFRIEQFEKAIKYFDMLTRPVSKRKMPL